MRRQGLIMGDKNPKAQQRAKAQDKNQKAAAKVAHDKKQAPPPQAAGKVKGK